MFNFKTLVRWSPLAGAASLALAITGCGGSSPQVTNFSEATFQNGLALAGDAVDLSTGTAADRRLGYFSDIYYDATRKEWWGLSDISPDGLFVYAMLQSAMLNEGGGNGVHNRIVKFDATTGTAVAQYAYRMKRSGEGQGISALVALGNDKFLVLERNNRGIGAGATLATADKEVYQIDLAGAVDVTNITLPTTDVFAGAVTKVGKVMDLAANTLTAIGNKSPEKWEGLAIGPQLANGSYVVLAGTDNDYSVTQSSSGTQYDVLFRFTDADPYASSIQCPIGTKDNCFKTSDTTPVTLSSEYALMPGILAAFTAQITNYVKP